MFSTETSSSNAIRSVVISPEIDTVRQMIENHHQNHQSIKIDIVEEINISSVVCVLSRPVDVEPKLENVINLDEGSMLIQSSKTTAIGPNTDEVAINPVNSIKDIKKQSSVSLERHNGRPLLETHL